MRARLSGGLRAAIFGVVCSLPLIESDLDARAEDPKPKRFFERNYAVAPGYDGSQRVPVRGAPQKEPIAPPAQVPQRLQEQASSLPKLQVNAKKSVVSVFVNSLDRSHFNRVLEEAIRLHDSNRVIMSGVFHIGDFEALTPTLEQNLSSRGIAIHQIAAADRELFAEFSPTWVISTRKGRHVAEGFLEIVPFFDEWGEYDPKRGEEPEKPSKMEDF